VIYIGLLGLGVCGFYCGLGCLSGDDSDSSSDDDSGTSLLILCCRCLCLFVVLAAILGVIALVILFPITTILCFGLFDVVKNYHPAHYAFLNLLVYIHWRLDPNLIVFIIFAVLVNLTFVWAMVVDLYNLKTEGAVRVNYEKCAFIDNPEEEQVEIHSFYAALHEEIEEQRSRKSTTTRSSTLRKRKTNKRADGETKTKKRSESTLKKRKNQSKVIATRTAKNFIPKTIQHIKFLMQSLINHKTKIKKDHKHNN